MSNKLFSTAFSKKPKTNLFNLSHEKKLSLEFGNLVPILTQEVLPGDSFKCNSELFMRFMPMLSPVMHRIDAYIHYFFVPNRLIWNEWEDFITGGPDGTLTPPPPTFNPATLNGDPGSASLRDLTNFLRPGSLADYLGYPICEDSSLTRFAPDASGGFSLLPLRAYLKIYNDYYRDQNLQDEIQFSTDGGDFLQDSPGFTDLFAIRQRCFEKDYFTSALPWPQRGPQVNLPTGTQADIKLRSGRTPTFTKLDGSSAATGGPIYLGNGVAAGGFPSETNPNLAYDPNGTLYADLSAASGATINDLRKNIKLQEWLEKNARGGARYIEQILSHFGVVSSDARLQRAEYLGGGKSPVAISEVLQQSATTATGTDTPLGTMGGRATSTQRSNGFKKRFEEHGFIIGILSVMPRTSYQNCCPKMLKRMDKFDFYYPEFDHLGEMPVRRGELYYDFNAGGNDGTFGYQSPWAEYKSNPSTVHGALRTSLDYWHLGRRFAAPPLLNAQFVQCNPTYNDFNRIFPVEVTEQAEEHLIVDIYNDIKAVRPMSKYGVPSF